MYLEVKDLTVYYDTALLLNEVSFGVDVGEMISLIGPNGAGKTSCLRAIAGLVQWDKDTLKGTKLGRITLMGSVVFDAENILGLSPFKIAKKGLTLCPERGKPFREMSTLANLKAGSFLQKDKKAIKKNLDRVYELFPILKERENQMAGNLSGGERTMLAIGRALMSGARLLLIDEPSTGLAPQVKEILFVKIREIRGLGLTIVMTEQDVNFAFNLAERNYLLSAGKVFAEGTKEDLLGDDLIRQTYLGL